KLNHNITDLLKPADITGEQFGLSTFNVDFKQVNNATSPPVYEGPHINTIHFAATWHAGNLRCPLTAFTELTAQKSKFHRSTPNSGVNNINERPIIPVDPQSCEIVRIWLNCTDDSIGPLIREPHGR